MSEEDYVKIIDKYRKGNVVIVEVEAMVNGKKQKTNFNFPLEHIEEGEWQRTIKKWYENLKEAEEKKPEDKIPLGDLSLE